MPNVWGLGSEPVGDSPEDFPQAEALIPMQNLALQPFVFPTKLGKWGSSSSARTPYGLGDVMRVCGEEGLAHPFSPGPGFWWLFCAKSRRARKPMVTSVVACTEKKFIFAFTALRGRTLGPAFFIASSARVWPLMRGWGRFLSNQRFFSPPLL